MEYSLTASYIDLERGVTKAEYHARYLDSHADVCRLQAVVALYFPPLKDTTSGLGELTNQFWGCQQHLLYQVSQGQPEHDQGGTRQQIVRLGREIAGIVRQAQNELAEMTQSMITFKGVGQ
jgi:hypothetical protein